MTNKKCIAHASPLSSPLWTLLFACMTSTHHMTHMLWHTRIDRVGGPLSSCSTLHSIRSRVSRCPPSSPSSRAGTWASRARRVTWSAASNRLFRAASFAEPCTMLHGVPSRAKEAFPPVGQGEYAVGVRTAVLGDFKQLCILERYVW